MESPAAYLCCLFLPVTEHLHREGIRHTEVTLQYTMENSNKVYMGINMLKHCYGPLKPHFVGNTGATFGLLCYSRTLKGCH